MKTINEDVWQRLESTKSNISSGYLTQRILPKVDYDVYLAIEQQSSDRLLILRVRNGVLD